MTTTNRLIDLRTKLWPLSNDQSNRIIQRQVELILARVEDNLHYQEKLEQLIEKHGRPSQLRHIYVIRAKLEAWIINPKTTTPYPQISKIGEYESLDRESTRTKLNEIVDVVNGLLQREYERDLATQRGLSPTINGKD